MPSLPRSVIFNPFETGIYHCTARCVRRAHLCGTDRYTKKNYDHRRDWIEQRIEFLAGQFAVDVIFFAIMGNHLHVVIRNLPDRVAGWSDRQVIKRACKIFHYKFKELGVEDGEPTAKQLDSFVKDRKLVEEMRKRLSDISWFMRQLLQHVARRANSEDARTGHFFEARFHAVVVTDKAGLLICGIYVDLNQIRAGESQTPETSKRTSAFRRIKGQLARRRSSAKASAWDGFLCPLNVEGDGQGAGYARAGTEQGARASDKGLLEMTLEDYLQLLDWTGRQVGRDKRGRIAADLPPILDRLGLSGGSFIDLVEQFESLFHLAVGKAQSLCEFAESIGRKWMKKTSAVSELEQG